MQSILKKKGRLQWEGFAEKEDFKPGIKYPMECGSYRGVKLLEHAMKVVERIFEHRIRQQIEIDDMQFGFMKDSTVKCMHKCINTSNTTKHRPMPPNANPY